MADSLHDALRNLTPIDWSDVPSTDDTLAPFLRECLTSASLLCDSVPPTASTDPTAEPHFTTPDQATCAKETFNSPIRSSPTRADHETLRKTWGKPVNKPANNAVNVALYKMAGKDRHGAWFSRYSVHEGLGFSKFKRAMEREFADSLFEEGGPGAGAKRGLAADQRVEKREVAGLATMEVYQLSAQMPAPVTPREFTTLFITSNHLGELAEGDGGEEGKKAPRSFVTFSKPVEHPDTPARSSFVKGKYESVEMIREIPVERGGADHDDELNPVEWIMITRSDPGGGIPRFLVDRGTPDAMIGDVSKFLDWACTYEGPGDKADAEVDQQARTSSQPDQQQTEPEKVHPAAQNTDKSTHEPPTALPVDAKEENGGIVSNFTQSVEAGLTAYAPAPVSAYVHDTLHGSAPSSRRLSSSASSSSVSSSSSTASFASATELQRYSTAETPSKLPTDGPSDSTSQLSATAGTTSENRHDKELAKISAKRAKLEASLAKKRAAEQSKIDRAAEKDTAEMAKAREKMEREVKKTEERHKREMEKLERKREKETKKAEVRRRKRDEVGTLTLVARERDDLRANLEVMRRENALLLERVGLSERKEAALQKRLEEVAGDGMVKEVLSRVESSGGKEDGVPEK